MSDLKCCGHPHGGPCEGPVKIRRQNTQYHWDEKSGDPDPNLVTCCDLHFKEIQEYWSERWAEYWSGVL
jgi:hypothetical protein